MVHLYHVKLLVITRLGFILIPISPTGAHRNPQQIHIHTALFYIFQSSCEKIPQLKYPQWEATK
jgi:hypothetical protein